MSCHDKNIISWRPSRENNSNEQPQLYYRYQRYQWYKAVALVSFIINTRFLYSELRFHESYPVQLEQGGVWHNSGLGTLRSCHHCGRHLRNPLTTKRPHGAGVPPGSTFANFMTTVTSSRWLRVHNISAVIRRPALALVYRVGRQFPDSGTPVLVWQGFIS